MPVRLRPSGFAASSRFRTLLLIWALCAAVICPAAWQSLSSTLRATDAAHGAAVFGSATVTPTGWMWENLGLHGRHFALSDARIAPALPGARLVASGNVPKVASGNDPKAASGDVPNAAPVGLASRLAPYVVLPEPELAPAARARLASPPRLPATRGFFCRPPPSLKA